MEQGIQYLSKFKDSVKTFLLFGIIAAGFLIPRVVFAAEESVQSFTLDGKLYSNSSATEVMKDTGTMIVQIVDSTQMCILYEESQLFDTTMTGGKFNIRVGESTTTHLKRSSGDSGHSLATVFANRGGTLAGKKVTDQSACTGSLSSGSTRYIRMVIIADSNPVPRAMSPFSLDSTPAAWVAETLQGIGPTGFINVNNTAPASLTQFNVESVFSTTNFPILMGVLGNGANGYVQNASNGTVAVPSVSGTPSSPTAGQMWYDAGELKYWDGSSTKSLGTVGSGITSIGIGTGLTPTGTITAGGTTIAVDVGTGVGQIVQVQTGNKLPVLDGSNVTNVTASGLTSTASVNTSGTITSGNQTVNGTISSTGNISSGGNISAASGSMSAQSMSANTTNFRSLTLSNAATDTVTIQPNAAMTGAPLTFTLPSSYPSSTGFILSSDTSGALSWKDPSLTTGATGILPIANGGTGSSTQNFVDLTTAQTVAGVKTFSSNAVFSGNVGIGTTNPGAKLDIVGQVYSRVYNNVASMTFNFDNGNVQYTSASCGASTLQNMKDGASYTVVIQGTTAGTCTFSNGGDTFKYVPANSATIGGTQTMYNFVKVGSTVYVTWTTGF